MAPGERIYTGSRVQKLGARPGMTAVLHSVPDRGFAAELADAGVRVARGDATGVDLVFLGVASRADLDGIGPWKDRLARNGALWLIRPKGKGTQVPELATYHAGQDVGLVDVKVVSFSDTHSAVKFVYRLRDR